MLVTDTETENIIDMKRITGKKYHAIMSVKPHCSRLAEGIEMLIDNLQGSRFLWKTWKNETIPGKLGKIMEFSKTKERNRP